MLTESSDALQEALVSGFVIFMMVSVGLDLTADKLKAVFRAPRVLFSALTVNYGIIPLVFLALIQLTGLEGMWVTGLLFVAVAPGGPVAVVLIQNARGHLALGVSLLILMNLLNTIATPLGIWAVDAMPLTTDGQSPVWGMIRTIVLVQLVPLAAAMVFRARRSELAIALQPRFERASKILLVVVAIGVLASELQRIGDVPLALIIVCNVAALVSLLLGWWLTPGRREDKIAVALSTPYRSISVVLLLLTAWVKSPDAFIAAMLYSGTMLWMCLAASTWIRRRQDP